MLVRGTLAQTSVYALADIPATGDNAAPGLWIGILMLSGAELASSVLLARRKRKA
ncbi:MAG: hypothetical protein PHC80_00540 [Eubacteriales bacterium]|nr:hypothetical protein [Eubacteriales bacterium]